MIYLQLFVEYFKIGLFAIGGGLATLPFLYDLSAKFGWFPQELIADMIAVSESTPGPIGVNMATYTGFSTAGFGGALCATLGLVTPSIIIIILVAKFLSRYQDNPKVEDIFYGLRPAVTALITVAVLQVLVTTFFYPAAFDWGNLAAFFNWKALVLFAIVMYFIKKLNRHPLFYLAGCALIGIIFRL